MSSASRRKGAVSELESRRPDAELLHGGQRWFLCGGLCRLVQRGSRQPPVEVGSVITVYIAADPSVAITTEPPAASDSGSGESASSSEETAPDDTVHDTD